MCIADTSRVALACDVVVIHPLLHEMYHDSDIRSSVLDGPPFKLAAAVRTLETRAFQSACAGNAPCHAHVSHRFILLVLQLFPAGREESGGERSGVSQRAGVVVLAAKPRPILASDRSDSVSITLCWGLDLSCGRFLMLLLNILHRFKI